VELGVDVSAGRQAGGHYDDHKSQQRLFHGESHTFKCRR
jgi:hypothetical protein